MASWQPSHSDNAEPHGRSRLSRRHLLRGGAALAVLAGFGPVLMRPAFAQPAPAAASPYRLPWRAGRSFRVSQTQGSSHQGAMIHALDFAVPLGEEVVAARGGTVAFREDKYGECGGPALATRGNYVVIDHGDGTSALYLHLQRVQVQVGQSVAQGATLGTSGSTGWTGCTAHLHFQVQQTWSVWFARSLPVVFSDPDVLAQDPSGRIHYNREYRSGNGLSGSAGAPTQVAGAVGEVHSGQHFTVTQAAFVRERPAMDARQLGFAFPGQEFAALAVVTGQAVIPSENRWIRIRLGERDGYVYAGLARALPGASSAVARAETAESPVLVAGAIQRSAGSARLELTAWLREQPTRQSRGLGILPAGTTVEVKEIVGGEEVESGESRWAHVGHAGRTGYLYWGVLAADTVTETAVNSAVTRAALALRERPTTASARMRLVPAGTTVQILEEVEGQTLLEGGNRWAHVRVDGAVGYMFRAQLQAG